MKVFKQAETKTSKAFIAISWFDENQQPYGFFLQGDSLQEVENQMKAEFFGAFEEIAKEFST